MNLYTVRPRTYWIRWNNTK